MSSTNNTTQPDDDRHDNDESRTYEVQPDRPEENDDSAPAPAPRPVVDDGEDSPLPMAQEYNPPLRRDYPDSSASTTSPIISSDANSDGDTGPDESIQEESTEKPPLLATPVKPESASRRFRGSGHESADADEPALPTGTTVHNGRWMWGWFVALLGWSILLSFYGLDTGDKFKPPDGWVAQTAREMLDRGDWIVPYFSGEIRLHKSPGPYWAVMAASYLTGGEVTTVSARIPSAIFGVVFVLTVFWMTRTMASDRAAIFAGFAASSSILFFNWSHRPASDLGVAVLCMVALQLLYLAWQEDRAKRVRNACLVGAYFVAGLGMLYKMPMPLPCVGVPAVLYGLYLLIFRRRVDVIANAWHLVGLAAFCVPWLPWVIGIVMTEDRALLMWQDEFLDRFTGAMPNVSHQTEWYWYLAYLPVPLVYTLPFALSLPAAIARPFRRESGLRPKAGVFLLLWFVGLFLFFTAAVGKEDRYLLPALPPLFVLLGVELSVLFDPHRRVNEFLSRLATWAVWILVPIGFAAGLYGLRYWQQYEQLVEWQTVWPPYVVMAVLFVVGTSLSAWWYRRGQRNVSFGALVATMWVVFLWAWPAFMPLISSEAGARNFADQLATRLTDEQKQWLYHVGSQDGRIIWYSDVRMPRIMDQLELKQMQVGKVRTREMDERLIGRRMVERLSGDEPILLVSSRPDYVKFQIMAPQEIANLAAVGEAPEGITEMPETYLWLQTEGGTKKYKHYVVFGNMPPPWGEVELQPSSETLTKFRHKWYGDSASTQSAETDSGTE